MPPKGRLSWNGSNLVVHVKQPVGAAAQHYQRRNAPKQNDRHVSLLLSICPQKQPLFTAPVPLLFLPNEGTGD
jgi:hypothetical protein